MKVAIGFVCAVVLSMGSVVSSSAGSEGVMASQRVDTIEVPDMQCGMCEMKISKRLKKIAGVSAVEADAEANSVVVTYDPTKTSLAALEKAIAEVGYDAGDAKTTKAAQAKLHGCCRPTE